MHVLILHLKRTKFIIPLALFLCGVHLGGKEMLGFQLDNAVIDVEQIRRGGPMPDGIPSIDKPRFTAARRVNYLQDSDMVIGYTANNVTRAYPLRILIWHEIVNDTVGGRPVAIVYCPLCGTAMVFDRTYGKETLTFGVSGLLYQSDVLMFDRETKSLWSQLGIHSVAGDYAGTELS